MILSCNITDCNLRLSFPASFVQLDFLIYGKNRQTETHEIKSVYSAKKKFTPKCIVRTHVSMVEFDLQS